ncbi:MAG: DNA translocase FtsK 4TM domain-containing protein [Syntrophaceae bacterium]
MPKKSSPPIDKQQVIALGLGALGLFLILALVSYSASDPGFSHATRTEQINNWMGLVGAYIADGLIVLLGLGAAAIPLFFAEYAYLIFRRREIHWIKLLSSFIILFVFLSLLGVFFGESAVLGGAVKAGGALGAVVGKGLKAYLNPWGALILLLTMLLAALMLGYDMERLVNLARGLLILERKEKPRSRAAVAAAPGAPAIIAAGGEEKAERRKKKEPQISRLQDDDLDEVKEIPIQARLGFIDDYQLPPRQLLKEPESTARSITPKELKANAELITTKLKDFGVDGEILEIKPGPLITMYEFTPAPGIKINKIVNLADDLAMALKASPVRVVAPIPNKNAVGIEIPNRTREIVYLRNILSSKAFLSSQAPLSLALGSDIEGGPVVQDLAKMPHLLIAGATGTGKSVGLNTMILSLLYRCDPSELKFIMIDPKRIELSHYEGIPHLLHPVVTDPKLALPILKWAVAEMETRYGLFKDLGVKSVESFNRKVKADNKDATTTLAMRYEDEGVLGILPRLVIVIDEMADLMMVNREVEEYIARLAQMARAAGMYMIVATQRPSVDVVTGLIKANFPTRISFRVSSKIDSRTILDGSGAEQLLGMGDMLLLTPGNSGLVRVHGAYVSEDEVDKVVTFIKEQKGPEYVKDIEEHIETVMGVETNGNGSKVDGYDPMYDEALEFVTNKGTASISLIQRRFRIGYNRAARIIEQMEHDGILGPADTAGKPRKVLVKSYAKEMEE